MKRLFNGRISQGLFLVSILLLGTTARIVSISLKDFRNSPRDIYYVFIILIYLLIALIIFVMYLTVYAKRFHDFGKSGYFSLLGLVPLFQWIVFIYLIFKKGDTTKNKYGDIPQKLIF